MKFKKVAIYLRKSRDIDGAETKEETLARHEIMLTEYCKRNNLIVDKIYKEVASGESLEARPEALKMLEDVAIGNFDGVVVVELERLSRGNQIDQVEIMEVFKKSKTKIYTLNKVYDLASENEFDEDFFEFGLFMSRREYKTIKRRLIRGKKQAQKEGYFIGSSLPYGFSKKKGERGYILIPNDYEANVVKTIFNKYVYEDYSTAMLRVYLNDSGIKPQRIERWKNSTIKHLLRNKTYAGYVSINTKLRSTTEYYKGKHEPIIDLELYEKAQEKLKSNAPKVKMDFTLQNSLSTICKCSICGASMGKLNNSIRCLTYNCPTKSSYFDLIERKLIAELETELKNFNYFIANYGEETHKQHELAQVEILALKKTIDKKSKMIDKACEMLELGVYSTDKYISRVKILESEITAIQNKIEDLQQISIDETEKIKSAIPILEKCLKHYWELSPINKNELLKSLIEKIEYTKLKKNNRFDGVDNVQLKIFLKI